MAVILSVSIDSKQKAFLEEIKVSPSALLQRCINELMQNTEISKEYVQKLQSRMSMLQETITKQGEFINNKGLWEEYMKL